MRLIREVKLRFFQDGATGEWGLTHQDTQDDSYGNGFNAFWGGIGIFHDIFEHWHEHTHKYFRGDYAMNIGGEMSAMGAMWYYFDTLGVRNRDFNPHSMLWMGDSMRKTTEDLIRENIEHDGSNYGSVLECGVPKQRPTENGELECQIDTMWENVKEMIPGKSHLEYKSRHPESTSDDREIEYGIQYKNSVTKRKIADLHRWGYRQAERDIPDTIENRDTLSEFIRFWNEFCKAHRAEDIGMEATGIDFRIYKERGQISWVAEFTGLECYDDEANSCRQEELGLNSRWQISSKRLPMIFNHSVAA